MSALTIPGTFDFFYIPKTLFTKIHDICKGKNLKINCIEIIQTPFSAFYSIISLFQKVQIIDTLTQKILNTTTTLLNIATPILVIIGKISALTGLIFTVLALAIENMKYKKIIKFSQNELFEEESYQLGQEKILKIRLEEFQKKYLNNPHKAEKLKPIIRPWACDKIKTEIPKIITELNDSKKTNEEKTNTIQKANYLIQTMKIQCQKSEKLTHFGILILLVMMFAFLLQIFPLKKMIAMKCIAKYASYIPTVVLLFMTAANIIRWFVGRGILDSEDHKFNLKNATINPIKETYIYQIIKKANTFLSKKFKNFSKKTNPSI
ncbi:MAG: hypothetical protein AMS24_05325 [Chlamydiae bacterium SM23_39]|nr:MAG: hypothetical protein AMS24_05325 [Chlamydiae bacterium SM23_39]